MTKNSIQILYEIATIRPIKFHLVKTSGPAHKPNFIFKLSITINGECKEFLSQANSTKNAKRLASINCLQFLMSENLIDEINSTFIRTILDSESKELLDNEPKETVPPVVHAVNLEKKTNELSRKHNKIHELIITKNKLSILHHMLTNTDFSFTDLPVETSMALAGTFRAELRIVKNEKFIEKYGQVLKERLTCTKLCSEDSSEFKLLGMGPSKKLARLRAAQLALENIFGIVVDDSGISIELVKILKVRRSTLKKRGYWDRVFSLDANPKKPSTKPKPKPIYKKPKIFGF